MEKTVLIIELAFLLEWGRNLISPIPRPNWEKAASRPTAAIMAEAKPTSSGEYNLATIIQKAKPRRAFAALAIIK